MWLASAIRLLRTLVPGLIAGEALETIGIPGFAGGGGFLPGLINGEEPKKRRRRRRALTQSDKNDIAFVAATLGQPAAKSFALIIAARVA